MESIVIYGAGGLGREILSLIRSINQHRISWNVLGFIDDSRQVGELVNGAAVLGNSDFLAQMDITINVVIAVGKPQARRIIKEKIQNPNVSFPILIHPSIEIERWQNVEIGAGTIICAGNIISTDITIGAFVVINWACTVGHDVVIGDYCCIMPGVNVSGCITMGEEIYVGTGAKLIDHITIGSSAVIGAGAVVINSVEGGTTHVGVPSAPRPKGTTEGLAV